MKQTDTESLIKLPYFDYLLHLLATNNAAVAKSFGRHVHWGYWAAPKTASLSDDDFAKAAEQLTAQVCASVPVDNNLHVLDVGCGFGGTVAFLNETYTGMQLVGVNIDARQLERARACVVAAPTNTVDFQQGNACALPFADNSFDVVLAVECIFHFPSRALFFQEAFRVLKPNGYLALSDFLPSSALLPFSKMNWFGRFYGQCHLDYRYKDYRQLATTTGFNALVERDITANTLPTYDYLNILAKQQGISHQTARLETAVVAILSRLHLLDYVIFSWQKV